MSQNRYIRQSMFSGIGEAGQSRIQQGRVLVAGCGALGSVIANTLARAGVGFLRIVDRDFLELNNLQRQVLFDEQDVKNGLPKAVAAANKLHAINSEITVEPIVSDINFTNIVHLCEDVDVIVDGTDNFEIRFLLNDTSIQLGIPWIYGGCVGADGQSMAIIPGKTPCLACLMGEGPPPPGTTATCDTAGILSPVINIIASLEAAEALKILSGNADQVNRCLAIVDVWNARFRNLKLDSLFEQSDCKVCRRREFEWLNGERGSQSAVLCGRNSVQLTFPGESVDLKRLESELEGSGKVERNQFLLKFHIDQFQITLFPDARAIITGTEDISVARSIYAKYIGV